MIPRSRGVAIAALVLAGATHVLALHDFSAAEAVLVEGGGAGEVAALGDSFKDYVSGATASTPITAHQPAVTPTQQKSAVRPTVQPQAAVTQAISPAQPSTAATSAVAVQQTPVSAQKTEAVKSLEQAKPETQTAKAVPTETPPKKVNQVASKAGNAEKSAKKGNASGQSSKGAATAQKTKSKAAGQGNAEASNYAGHVKRKITRARRKSVNIRGTAIVSFRIGDNGGLLSVRISRSSGSKRLDQVALAQVRSAAPFQPPPAAARRDYTIKIVGK